MNSLTQSKTLRCLSYVTVTAAGCRMRRHSQPARTQWTFASISQSISGSWMHQVAQDTAYWDLNEAEHERLQQNMLDVQMQHEALSARYQAEQRHRPETLNR